MIPFTVETDCWILEVLNFFNVFTVVLMQCFLRIGTHEWCSFFLDFIEFFLEFVLFKCFNVFAATTLN